MDATEALAPLKPGPENLDDLMALVAGAGWNQTPADWRMMMALGTIRGFADETGRVVASAVTMPYRPSLGWIGMVLVAPDWRRRGLATRLLDDCIARLEAAGKVQGLDATPAGEPVYAPLGFAGTFGIHRWRRTGGGTAGRAPSGIRPATSADLPWIAAADARSFGADRAAVIGDIVARPDHKGWAASNRTGFLLSRAGRTARHLGPLAAETDAVAEALLTAALAETDGPAVIDLPDRHTGLAALLEAHGFARERPFLRMYRGRVDAPGDPARLYALAGPELG